MQPGTLRTAGISPEKMKWLSSVLCGAFCGLAGAQLALGNVTMFAEGMSNSRGYVAFACVIFGAANPWRGDLRRHGVSDPRGNLLPLEAGTALEAEVVSVKKGRADHQLWFHPL